MTGLVDWLIARFAIPLRCAAIASRGNTWRRNAITVVRDAIVVYRVAIAWCRVAIMSHRVVIAS